MYTSQDMATTAVGFMSSHDTHLATGSLEKEPTLEPRLGDKRIKDAIPTKLKGKTNPGSGSFCVLSVNLVPEAAGASRDAAAKRTSENTARAARLAAENPLAPVSQRKAPLAPAACPPAQQRQSPLTAAETKREQARLLALLRSLQPAQVVDQLCRALAFFGGIPGAPASSSEHEFPPSFAANGPGSAFVGWLAEIFPPTGRVVTSELSTAVVRRKVRSRPRGTKSLRAREPLSANVARGVPARARSVVEVGGRSDGRDDDGWVDVEEQATGFPREAATEGTEACRPPVNLVTPTVLGSDATPNQGPQQSHAESQPSKRRRGRPKGSKNRPKGNLQSVQETTGLSTAPLVARKGRGRPKGSRNKTKGQSALESSQKAVRLQPTSLDIGDQRGSVQQGVHTTSRHVPSATVSRQSRRSSDESAAVASASNQGPQMALGIATTSAKVQHPAPVLDNHAPAKRQRIAKTSTNAVQEQQVDGVSANLHQESQVSPPDAPEGRLEDGRVYAHPNEVRSPVTAPTVFHLSSEEEPGEDRAYSPYVVHHSRSNFPTIGSPSESSKTTEAAAAAGRAAMAAGGGPTGGSHRSRASFQQRRHQMSQPNSMQSHQQDNPVQHATALFHQAGINRHTVSGSNQSRRVVQWPASSGLSRRTQASDWTQGQNWPRSTTSIPGSRGRGYQPVGSRGATSHPVASSISPLQNMYGQEPQMTIFDDFTNGSISEFGNTVAPEHGPGATVAHPTPSGSRGRPRATPLHFVNPSGATFGDAAFEDAGVNTQTDQAGKPASRRSGA